MNEKVAVENSLPFGSIFTDVRYSVILILSLCLTASLVVHGVNFLTANDKKTVALTCEMLKCDFFMGLLYALMFILFLKVVLPFIIMILALVFIDKFPVR